MSRRELISRSSRCGLRQHCMTEGTGYLLQMRYLTLQGRYLILQSGNLHCQRLRRDHQSLRRLRRVARDRSRRDVIIDRKRSWIARPILIEFLQCPRIAYLERIQLRQTTWLLRPNNRASTSGVPQFSLPGGRSTLWPCPCSPSCSHTGGSSRLRSCRTRLCCRASTPWPPSKVGRRRHMMMAHAYKPKWLHFLVFE